MIRLGNLRRRANGMAPGTPATEGGAYLRRIQASVRRHIIFGIGIANSALAVALAVSFIAVAYAETPRPGSLAEVSDDVITAEVSTSYIENYATTALEEPPPLPPASALIIEPMLAAAQASRITPPAASIPVGPRVQVSLSREGLTLLGRVNNVNVTFYDCADQGFCGAMYNGRKVYEGAAACSWNLPIGTKFAIVGDPTRRVYVCEDRGLLPNTWVDIFWYYPSDGYRWQAAVGRYGTIEIFR